MNDSLSKIVYFFVVKPIIYLKIFLIYSRKVNLIRLETSFIMSTELDSCNLLRDHAFVHSFLTHLSLQIVDKHRVQGPLALYNSIILR